MGYAMKQETGRFLSPPQMGAFKGASTQCAGLWSPVPHSVLKRLGGQPFRSAAMVLGVDTGPRTVVLLMQFGRMQFAGVVPVVDTLTQRWLVDAMQQHHLLQWVLQSDRAYRLMRSQYPVPDLESSAGWWVKRQALLSAPLNATPQARSAALREVLDLLRDDPVDLEPARGALQRWAFVCLPTQAAGLKAHQEAQPRPTVEV
jgi:hypothetical protein